MSDTSNSDPIDKACHEAKVFWEKTDKWFLENKTYFLELMGDSETENDVWVDRERLINLFLHAKALRHIISCDECDVAVLEVPLKLTRHRSEQKK